MAGDSADDVARQAREKAERLLKRAEMFEKGAQGERVVAGLLAQLPPDWFVLNDIAWPGRQRANIDHVVVGPTGIYVIDAKNWDGSVTISRGVLRQNGYNRTKAIDGARAASSALSTQITAVPANTIVPVICFVGHGHVEGELNGVLVCSINSLHATLLRRPTALSPELLQFLRFDLDMSSSPASGPRRQIPTPSTPRPMRPPPGPPLAPVPWASSARPTRVGSHRSRPTNQRSRLSIVLEGIGLWWLSCVLLYVALKPIAHPQAQVFGPAYFFALVGVIAWSVRRFRRRRSNQLA